MNSLIQCYGLLKKEVHRLLKVPLQTICAPLISISLYFLIFGINLGRTIDITLHVSYLGFLIPGLSALSIIKNAFDNSTTSIIVSKYTHELQDLRVVPLTINQIIFSKSGASVLRSIFLGIGSFYIGEILLFISEKTWLSILYPFLFFYFIMASSLMFSFLGIAIGMWAKTFEHTTSIAGLILLPLIYLGGIFFTLSSLPPLWQKVSYCNPVFYLIHGIRFSVLGISQINLILSMILSLAFVCISYLCAYCSLKNGTRYI